MKTLLHRLLDSCPPDVTHRVFFDHIADLEKEVKAEQKRGAARLRNAKALHRDDANGFRRIIRKCNTLYAKQGRELAETERARAQAQRQFEETKRVNAGNAAIERLTQVQVLKLNNALDAAGLSHLSIIHPSLAASHGLEASQPKPVGG